MRRQLVLVLALVICTALVGVAASTVGAQDGPVPFVPPYCELAGYDLNRDGRVSEKDLDWWKIAVYTGEVCTIGADAELCPLGTDVNGDGIVTLDDVRAWYEHYFSCLRGNAVVRP